ncbi:MAG: hypothetical protein R3192_06880 [Woeseiaceae bacterium]|nr:hypothetical protein [Woeseiaceae bacterium]
MRVFGELRRRNVFKVSVGYSILVWLLVRLFNSVSSILGADERAVQIFALLLILGFPVIVLFAWAYEITPEGLKPTSQVEKTQSITRETGRKLNVIVLALLAVATVVLLVEYVL